MLILTDAPQGVAVVAGGDGQVACPRCAAEFKPRRKDQRYCGKPCAKAATRNAARGSRDVENAQRNEGHYSRAAWLSFDVLRMPPEGQRRVILRLLEAASGPDAPLCNILLDPALLGAPWGASDGKLYPDTHDTDARNIAKLVDAFCRLEWGCGMKATIKDLRDGDWMPAHRTFAEVAPAPAPLEETYWQAQRRSGQAQPPVRLTTPGAYDWRKLGRAMRDRGWQRYMLADGTEAESVVE